MWQTNQYVLIFVRLSFQLSLSFSIRSFGFCIFNVALYLSKRVTSSSTKFRLNRKQFGKVQLKDTAASPIVSAVIDIFLLPILYVFLRTAKTPIHSESHFPLHSLYITAPIQFKNFGLLYLVLSVHTFLSPLFGHSSSPYCESCC